MVFNLRLHCVGVFVCVNAGLSYKIGVTNMILLHLMFVDCEWPAEQVFQRTCTLMLHKDLRPGLRFCLGLSCSFLIASVFGAFLDQASIARPAEPTISNKQEHLSAELKHQATQNESIEQFRLNSPRMNMYVHMSQCTLVFRSLKQPTNAPPIKSVSDKGGGGARSAMDANVRECNLIQCLVWMSHIVIAPSSHISKRPFSLRATRNTLACSSDQSNSRGA